MAENDQIAQFTAGDGDGGAPPPPDQPKVPFQTDLKLTADQEKKMIEHAFMRYQALNAESGRSEVSSPTWWMNTAPAPNPFLASQGMVSADTFLGKRSRYDATFLNDVSWRPYTMGPDNIFSSSNISVPLVRRICRQMIARAKKSFFGSEPWFSVDPAPHPSSTLDEGVADKIENFCRFKTKEANSKEDKGRAISRALILGECAVKTSYVVRDQMYNVEATVLTDMDGKAVRAGDGNFITPEDQWEDSGLGDGNEVLSRDNNIVKPEAPVWTSQPLDRRQVLFEGAKSEVIFFKDFLCPITAPDEQQADCIIHLYDKAVMEFVDLVVKRGMVENTTEGRKGAASKMIALVKSMANNTSAPKSAMSQDMRPGENFMSVPDGSQGAGPVAEFAEFYMWYDANEDGIAENIMLICDRVTRMPIFYDHVANVTTDGKRPIEIVRINPVEGRWYGLGIMELFESYGMIVDLLTNRWNFSQSRAGRVDFWNPNNTLEGDRDPNLKMNYGRTYTLKNNADPEKTLKSMYLNDTKFDQIKEMIEFFLQLAMNESGVSNANDDQAAGMQSAKLATGIMNVQANGDELFAPIVDDLKGPLTRLIEREVDVILANMNEVEAFSYLEGDTMGIDKLTPQDVRGLKFKITIELTEHKNQQQLQVSSQAAAIVEKFYMLPPQIQVRVADLYKDQIKALCPKVNVDQIIQPMQPGELAPPPDGAEPGAGGGAGAPKLGEGGAGASTPFPTQLTQAPAAKVSA